MPRKPTTFAPTSAALSRLPPSPARKVTDDDIITQLPKASTSRITPRSSAKRLRAPGSVRWLASIIVNALAQLPATSAHGVGLTRAQAIITAMPTHCEPSSIAVSRPTSSRRLTSAIFVDANELISAAAPIAGSSATSAGWW